MIDNLDIYLSAIVDYIKNSEFNQAKDKLDLALKDMIALDFKNRQDCVRKINVQVNRLRKAKTSTLSAIDSLPEELRLHALESMKDTVESIEKKIIEYQRQKAMLSQPRYNT
jgi:hypothetical protein